MNTFTKRKTWDVSSSDVARRTHNPIRAIVQSLKIEPNPEKKMIPLSIGDPTVFGNLPNSEVAITALCENIKAKKHNGYAHSCGILEARQAIAEKYSSPEAPLTEEDIVIGAGGCSHAIEMCISALLNEGDNVLIASPSFPLYEVFCKSKAINIKHYKLIPERNWEVDTEHLSSLIDDSTKAIIVNNPSNPCGSVFSKSHLLEILAVAGNHCVPIISDEIYADMAFPPYEFTPLATLSKNVPILTCGGLAKRYLVPGWRMGWLMIHDRNNVFAKEVTQGLKNLSALLMGGNTLTQSIIPKILHETEESFYIESMKILQDNARISYKKLSSVPGLNPIIPQGAMYMMVQIEVEKFKDITDCMDFVQKLICEQSVFVLPGKCFNLPNYFRVVFTAPQDKLTEAYDRIAVFCREHSK